MKKLLYFLIGIVAVIGILMFVNRDIVTYKLDKNDVVASNGDYRFVGRVNDKAIVEKVEVYGAKGESRGTFTLDDVTKDAMKDFKFTMIYSPSQFKGLKMTTGKEDGKDKIYLNFEYGGVEYKHKLLPNIYPNGSFFYWNEIHITKVQK